MANEELKKANEAPIDGAEATPLPGAVVEVVKSLEQELGWSGKNAIHTRGEATLQHLPGPLDISDELSRSANVWQMGGTADVIPLGASEPIPVQQEPGVVTFMYPESFGRYSIAIPTSEGYQTYRLGSDESGPYVETPSGERFSATADKPVTMGRMSESDITNPDGWVSADHFSLEVDSYGQPILNFPGKNGSLLFETPPPTPDEVAEQQVEMLTTAEDAVAEAFAEPAAEPSVGSPEDEFIPAARRIIEAGIPEVQAGEGVQAGIDLPAVDALDEQVLPVVVVAENPTQNEGIDDDHKAETMRLQERKKEVVVFMQQLSSVLGNADRLRGPSAPLGSQKSLNILIEQTRVQINTMDSSKPGEIIVAKAMVLGCEPDAKSIQSYYIRAVRAEIAGAVDSEDVSKLMRMLDNTVTAHAGETSAGGRRLEEHLQNFGGQLAKLSSTINSFKGKVPDDVFARAKLFVASLAASTSPPQTRQFAIKNIGDTLMRYPS